MDKSKVIQVLKMIEEDVANDAKEFDGKPFNGKTVAEYFGNHGASISALASIIKQLLMEIDYLSNDKIDQ